MCWSHKVSSPISRNLNNGDAIYLVLMGTHEAGTVSVRGTCRYAVTLSDLHITPQIYISY